ncbi:Lrp/AsnC family transcriptional regulator [Saccharibacillus alkalitolerans]|uniref:Lrp/AsnC family transcriptional regulator n=1 Tax=Saccharibacillus alkalitolerans TaxID=2705290 RepID=A0ABX0F1F8_9BACL|nr:Lrp/AsnC family transcriptional regulator [Saccharibacillus alkalitolerans]NGZ74812.1 Lrp/AsnC family transcriptional regulator [Saccharibacillus alkalitolerans]
MDHVDLRIVEELSQNGRITMKELGERVHLTGQAAAARVLKLEDRGVIKRYTVDVDREQLGYPVHAFLNIWTGGLSHQPYLTFIATQDEYVIRNHKISGESCYLLECRFPSNKVLDGFLIDLNRYVNYKLSIVVS